MYPLLYWAFYMHILFLSILNACLWGRCCYYLFFRWWNWGTKKLCTLLKGTSGEAGTCPRQFLLTLQALRNRAASLHSLLCLLKKPCALWLTAFLWLFPFPGCPPCLLSLNHFKHFWSSSQTSIPPLNTGVQKEFSLLRIDTLHCLYHSLTSMSYSSADSLHDLV